MFKKALLLGFLLLSAPALQAQEVFWGFDENDRELIIPPECDDSLAPQELFDVGIRLLEETGYARQGAPYCLMAAALDGHVEAQYEVARLYHKGGLLPKSDLAAYKWATLAALSGHPQADLLGANIEQFLSIQDIEISTKSLTNLIPVISDTAQRKLWAEVDKQEKIKQQIAWTKKDIRDLKAYGRMFPREAVETPKTEVSVSGKSKSVIGVARQNNQERARANEPIFSQRDLDNAPMPTAL